MIRTTCCALLLLIGVFGTGHCADDVVLYPGEQAVIYFEFSEPPVTSAGDPVNYLQVRIGGSYVDFLGDSRLVQSLHDGRQPLAVRHAARSDGMSILFVADDAVYDGELVDFEPIADGTIQGALTIRPVFAEGSFQSRIRFRGELITGRAVDGKNVAAGPSAQIVGCVIDSGIFSDRFAAQPALTGTPGSPRLCKFGG